VEKEVPTARSTAHPAEAR